MSVADLQEQCTESGPRGDDSPGRAARGEDVMATFRLIPVIDEGLGNSTYLLAGESGDAAVIDPERDLRPVRAAAAKYGLHIRWAIETHLHADFVSGVRELGAVEGAMVLGPDVGPREFAATALHDGEVAAIGDGLRLEACHTPGHSPEHLAYLLRDAAGGLCGVFTGGSLMVGTAGRTDLTGPEQTIPLARAQYRSLQRLMRLPDETPVWPTHGAGSFCSAASGTDRVSTIGRERATNPLLQIPDEDAFVAALLARLGTFPDYFLRLGALNRAGPAVLGDTLALTALPIDRVRTLIDEGAQIVDVRPMAGFAAAHVPGSLSITLRAAFPTWLGWLVDPGRPVIIVRDANQDSADIAWGAALVGFDTLAGEIVGGMPAWEAEIESTTAPAVLTEPLVTADELDTAPGAVLDVRQEAEFVSGHVPGAVSMELGALTEHAVEVRGPALVMCGHGERAMSAASILQRAGVASTSVFVGGPKDWARGSGRPLERGDATRTGEPLQRTAAAPAHRAGGPTGD